MFDGKEFMDVAKHLGASAAGSPHPEAYFRSAIGRAYYACFHACREKYFAPKRWGKADATHKAVRRVVHDKAKGLMPDWLDTLIELREHSDYHSWAPSQRAVLGPPPNCDCSWDPSPETNC